MTSTNPVVANAVASNAKVVKNAPYNRYDDASIDETIKRLEASADELQRLAPSVERAVEIISGLDPYQLEDPVGSDAKVKDNQRRWTAAIRKYLPLYKKVASRLKA